MATLRRGVLFAVLLIPVCVTLLLGRPALADTLNDSGRGHDPHDIQCIETSQSLPNGQRAASAPWYQYQGPGLLSDDREQHRRWLGWYYAYACASNPERRGQTWANLVVDDSSGGDTGAGPVVPVKEALPDGVSVPDPDIGALLVPAPKTVSATVPRSVAQRMVDAGFLMVQGPDGRDHILIDTSRPEYGGHADAYITWWALVGKGDFYLHDPAGFAADHPDVGGGIMRVHLGPVNLVLSNGTLLSTPVPGGTARVQVTVANHSNHIVKTNFGWRYRDDPPGQWHQALTGDLTPWVQGPVSFDVPARDGMLQVAVNYQRDKPDDEITYADNMVEIAVQTQTTDLVLVSLDGPASPVPPVDPPDLKPFVATATVLNTGPRDVTTDVQLTLSNQFVTDVAVGRQTVTIPAGGTVTVPFSVGSSVPGDTLHLVATVDPDNKVAESRKDNNSAALDVAVQQNQQQYDPGNSGGIDDILTK